jgi:hypothetical protein
MKDHFFDLMLATQMSTSFAWMCAIGAHLVSVYANPDWQFSVYVLLVISLVFMLCPYLIFVEDEPEEHNEHNTENA